MKKYGCAFSRGNDDFQLETATATDKLQRNISVTGKILFTQLKKILFTNLEISLPAA